MSDLDSQLSALAQVEAALDWDSHPTRLDPIRPSTMAEAEAQIAALARLAATLLNRHYPGWEDHPLGEYRVALIAEAAER